MVWLDLASLIWKWQFLRVSIGYMVKYTSSCYSQSISFCASMCICGFPPCLLTKRGCGLAMVYYQEDSNYFSCLGATTIAGELKTKLCTICIGQDIQQLKPVLNWRRSFLIFSTLQIFQLRTCLLIISMSNTPLCKIIR